MEPHIAAAPPGVNFGIFLGRDAYFIPNVARGGASAMKGSFVRYGSAVKCVFFCVTTFRVIFFIFLLYIITLFLYFLLAVAHRELTGATGVQSHFLWRLFQ